MLDTDILFSRVLHDLFGRLALRLRLFDLLWSDELLTEAKRKLVEEKALSAEIAERWVGYLAESFPAGRVEIADAPAALNLAELTADPDDHHVCALAVAGKADYLVTRDRGYSPDGLRGHGVEVVAPDDLLCRALDDQPQAVLDVLELQAGEWGGGRPVAVLLEAFERAGAPDFAGRARAELAGS
ncbi:MAG TPA: PIN domain-containing protein [Thermoleophilaceae bacterium]|nr:PIN domain-containing protein [Thermoleophilaceae bacterium]